jgi:hypothetical protein
MVRALILALAFAVSAAAIPSTADADRIGARKVTAKKKTKAGPSKRSSKGKTKPVRRTAKAKSKAKSKSKSKAKSRPKAEPAESIEKRPMP